MAFTINTAFGVNTFKWVKVDSNETTVHYVKMHLEKKNGVKVRTMTFLAVASKLLNFLDPRPSVLPKRPN